MATRSTSRAPESLIRNLGPAIWDTMGGIGDTAVGHLGTTAWLLGQDSDYWRAARQNRARARDKAYRRSGLEGGLQDVGAASALLLPLVYGSKFIGRGAGGLKGAKLRKRRQAAKSVTKAKKRLKDAQKTSWGRRLLKTAGWAAPALGMSYMGYGLSKSGQRASNAERERDEAIAGLQGLTQEMERRDAVQRQPRGGPGGAIRDPGADMGMGLGEFRPRSDVADWARQQAEYFSQPPPGRGSQGLGYRMGPGGWQPQDIPGHFLSANMGMDSPRNRRLRQEMRQDAALGAQRRDFYAGLAQAAESGAAPQQLQGLLNRVQTGIQMAPLHQQVREHQVALGMKDRELHAARRNDALRAVTGLAGQLPEYQRNPEQLQSFVNQLMSQVS